MLTACVVVGVLSLLVTHLVFIPSQGMGDYAVPPLLLSMVFGMAPLIGAGVLGFVLDQRE